MGDEEKISIELTHEEALMLCLLGKSSDCNSRVAAAVQSVGAKIMNEKTGLYNEQFALWESSGEPDFDLSAGPRIEP